MGHRRILDLSLRTICMFVNNHQSLNEPSDVTVSPSQFPFVVELI
jgi:hypothetical protein